MILGYSDFKRNDILKYSTAWMNFEKLSEINKLHERKKKYCIIPPITVPRISTFIWTEGRRKVIRAWGK